MRPLRCSGVSRRQREIAAALGISQPAVSQQFGSMARREAGQDSDIDLLVEAPEGMSSLAFIKFKQLIEQVLCQQIDLVDYGGLKPKLDDDIRRDALLLSWRSKRPTNSSIQAWMTRVDRSCDAAGRLYLADDLLQEAGDSLMMKLGEAAKPVVPARRPGA